MNVNSSRIGELLDYPDVKTVTGTIWESGTINGMRCNEMKSTKLSGFWKKRELRTGGGTKLQATILISMLENEKYKDDALQQKS